MGGRASELLLQMDVHGMCASEYLRDRQLLHPVYIGTLVFPDCFPAFTEYDMTLLSTLYSSQHQKRPRPLRAEEGILLLSSISENRRRPVRTGVHPLPKVASYFHSHAVTTFGGFLDAVRDTLAPYRHELLDMYRLGEKVLSPELMNQWVTYGVHIFDTNSFLPDLGHPGGTQFLRHAARTPGLFGVLGQGDYCLGWKMVANLLYLLNLMDFHSHENSCWLWDKYQEKIVAFDRYNAKKWVSDLVGKNQIREVGST